jgi:signal transduction histidine kinase
MNEQSAPEFDHAEQPARIIIVDDEIPQMEALCITLQSHGYTTVGYSSSADALGAIRNQRFDLLLTDLMMPDMDGVTLLNAALKVDKDLIGIMMTGYGTIKTAICAMKAGATDYILKPFNLSVILPILERSLSLRKLRLENAELEWLVRKRTCDLEASNRELEAFSYSVAHDLRAPLRSIHGFSQLLIEDHQLELRPVGKEHLTRIGNAVKRMDGIIESLLSLARLSQRSLKRSLVNLSDLAHRSVAELRRAYPDRSVEVVIAPQLNAECDGQLLSLAFDNLLSNAWKFSAKRLDSRIEMGCHSDGGPPIYFIRDNGAGFDSATAERLFEPFQRLHGQKEFEGTGVGLATVHRIIQRHGGRIWAESKPQEGATFFFTLPSGQEETRSHQRKTQPPSSI